VPGHKDKGYKGIGMEGRIATWYAKNSSKDIAEFCSLADRFANETPGGSRILDVASGPGYLSIELAKRGRYEVIGLDISKTFVELAYAAPFKSARAWSLAAARRERRSSGSFVVRARTIPPTQRDTIVCARRSASRAPSKAER